MVFGCIILIFGIFLIYNRQTRNKAIEHKINSSTLINNQFDNDTLEDQSLSNTQDKNDKTYKSNNDLKTNSVIPESSSALKANNKHEKYNNIRKDNKEKMESILKILNIEENDIVSDKLTDDKHNRERIVETKNCGVKFDVESGILRLYYSFLVDETIKEPVSEKVAVTNAIEFVSKLGIEVPEDYVASCVFCEKDNTGPNSEWQVKFQYKYKNIPIRYSHLSVSIQANDGSISSLIYAPVRDYPNSMIQNYPEDYAVKIAKDFLQTKYPDEYSLHHSELGIIYPNNRYQQEESSVCQENTKPRLCWIVVYRNEIGSLMYAVYIDTETGKVIGGL